MKIKVSVYIAISLDGFIARDDGGLDWLNEAKAPRSGWRRLRFSGIHRLGRCVDYELKDL